MSCVSRLVSSDTLTVNQTVNVRVGKVDRTVNKYANPRVIAFNGRIGLSRVIAFVRRNGQVGEAANGPQSQFVAFAAFAALDGATVSSAQ